MFHIFSILLKVSRVLPDWLASPNVIASDLKHKTTSVSEFKGLDPDIHLNLKENKIDYFFPGIFVFFLLLKNIKISFKLNIIVFTTITINIKNTAKVQCIIS